MDMEMAISEKLASYPEKIKPKIANLRKLIISTAKNADINDLQEALKWGELSYLTKHGSTIRIGWNSSSPDEYGLYFHCQTKLIATFRELFHKTGIFKFQGNRAIVLNVHNEIPEEALKQCILLALKYHKIKNLPMLGA